MSQPVIEPNFEGEEMKIPENMTPVETPVEPAKSVLSTGVIALLVIILLGIFAGLGYWYHLVMSTPIVDTYNTDTTENYPSTQPEPATGSLSDSDEIEDIEMDVENTDLDDLDREMSDIDAELEAALEASF
jgi:hypothetical protein